MIFRCHKFDEYKWHDYFCWLPVRLDNSRVVWLEIVNRKCFMNAHGDCGYEYKLKELK